jgi:hypothetical protein
MRFYPGGWNQNVHQESFNAVSDCLISALRSHATTCRAALPAAHSEPNLERRQYYNDDADQSAEARLPKG